MRLGSGRERSRCIMQFSLAAGSDRAAGGERARAGPAWKARNLNQREGLTCEWPVNSAHRDS